MNRQTADRIIVRSNERMELVINWYLENKEWLDKEDFLSSMTSGVVELCEEQLEFTFENVNDIVEISIYPTIKPNLPCIVTFDYNPKTGEITNTQIPFDLPQERRKLLSLTLFADNTAFKEAIKYHSLMMFMTHYREEVEIQRQAEYGYSKPKKKNHSKQRRRPLIRKTYIITDFDQTIFPMKIRAKRTYTKPSFEINVCGHFRHYKSGKIVWVKPSTRYKGNITKHKQYEL